MKKKQYYIALRIIISISQSYAHTLETALDTHTHWQSKMGSVTYAFVDDFAIQSVQMET